MIILEKSEIDKGLKSFQRTYLCGNLKNSTEAKYIKTDGYEIGITEYSKFTFEKPHLHTFNNEYNYVIEGQIKVLLLNEKRERLFLKGDLFVITPNEPYVCKGVAGTRIIFSKVPGGNDKVLVETSLEIEQWGKDWNTEYGDVQ